MTNLALLTIVKQFCWEVGSRLLFDYRIHLRVFTDIAAYGAVIDDVTN